MTVLRFALVGLVLVLAPPAAADAPVRYTVKQGDTCASIAQAFYGDERLVDILHQGNPSLAAVPPPHRLVEGTVLLIPPKPRTTSGPDAQLTTVRNHVEVMAPEPKAGKANDPLFRGNRVSTEAASAADVTFRDETQVKLGERTLVVILGDARSAAAKATETQTTLVTGNLRAWMAGPAKDAPPKGATTVATDAAKVRIWTGEAQVSADPKKTTRLAVYAGNSTVAARGKTAELGGGYGSKVELGKEPTPPHRLPAAPEWTTAPASVLVDEGHGAPSIAGAYAAASAATPARPIAEWRVQIARDEVFRDVVVDTRVPESTRRLDGQAPGVGHYFVRVSAIDDDHFEGPFGPTARILVLGVKRSTVDGHKRIALAPSDAFCVRIGNVALTRVQGGVIEAPLHEPIRVRCAPREADPSALLRLD